MRLAPFKPVTTNSLMSFLLPVAVASHETRSAPVALLVSPRDARYAGGRVDARLAHAQLSAATLSSDRTRGR